MWDAAGEAKTNINIILLWTPAPGHASVSQPAKTYINSVQAQDAA